MLARDRRIYPAPCRPTPIAALFVSSQSLLFISKREHKPQQHIKSRPKAALFESQNKTQDSSLETRLSAYYSAKSFSNEAAEFLNQLRQGRTPRRSHRLATAPFKCADNLLLRGSACQLWPWKSTLERSKDGGTFAKWSTGAPSIWCARFNSRRREGRQHRVGYWRGRRWHRRSRYLQDMQRGSNRARASVLPLQM